MMPPADYTSIKRDPTAEEIAMIRRYGKKYKAITTLPDDIEEGPLGWCFDWSMVQCMKLHEKYRYVEGIAKDPADNKWELHAWLTDGTHAFDATWGGRRPHKPGVHPKTKYIGIEMPLLAVMLFVKKTEYQGIIPNRDKDPGTLKRILEGVR